MCSLNPCFLWVSPSHYTSLYASDPRERLNIIALCDFPPLYHLFKRVKYRLISENNTRGMILNPVLDSVAAKSSSNFYYLEFGKYRPIISHIFITHLRLKRKLGSGYAWTAGNVVVYGGWRFYWWVALTWWWPALGFMGAKVTWLRSVPGEFQASRVHRGVARLRRHPCLSLITRLLKTPPKLSTNRITISMKHGLLG